MPLLPAAQGSRSVVALPKRMVQRIKECSGRLDVLINNIGEYKCAPLLEYPVTDFESTIQSNLLGSFYMIHYALPLLQCDSDAF